MVVDERRVPEDWVTKVFVSRGDPRRGTCPTPLAPGFVSLVELQCVVQSSTPSRTYQRPEERVPQ